MQSLTAEERRKLLAFMVGMEDTARTDYPAQLACKIDDASPQRWLTPEQVEQRLGLAK